MLFVSSMVFIRGWPKKLSLAFAASPQVAGRSLFATYCEWAVFRLGASLMQPEREDPREHVRPLRQAQGLEPVETAARVGVGLAAKASLQTGETPNTVALAEKY
jgi:hypothetical protein